MKNTINSKRFYLIMLMYSFFLIIPTLSHGTIQYTKPKCEDFPNPNIIYRTWVYVDENGRNGKIKHDVSLGSKTDKTKDTWLEYTPDGNIFKFRYDNGELCFTYADKRSLILFDSSRNIYLKINSGGQSYWASHEAGWNYYTILNYEEVNLNDWNPWVRGQWIDETVLPNDTRVNWQYSENGKTGNVVRTRSPSNWIETSTSGVKYNFIAYAVTNDYIELYDIFRGIYLRLYANLGKWSLDGSQWHEWVNGAWQGQTSGNTGNTDNADNRNGWTYTYDGKTGRFVSANTTDKAWRETNHVGNIFNFVEQSRTDSYVQIHDSSRAFTLRLYVDHAEFSTDSGSTWTRWVNGAWN